MAQREVGTVMDMSARINSSPSQPTEHDNNSPIRKIRNNTKKEACLFFVLNTNGLSSVRIK